MRILLSASVILLASALSLPSAACDRHGGGMFGQLNGASWTEYNPAAAESDALFLEKQLSEWHKQNAVPSAKPKKPTFSKVSNRASTAAKARLAAQAKIAKKENKQTSASENFESSSAAAILNVGR